MFAGGTYLRSLWKQKPQAWGPSSVVSSVLRTRFENYGIPWKCVDIALLGWGPGWQNNYAKKEIVAVNNNVDFENNALVFNSADAEDYINYGDGIPVGTNDITTMVRLSTTSTASQGIIGASEAKALPSGRYKTYLDSGNVIAFLQSPSGYVSVSTSSSDITTGAMSNLTTVYDRDGDLEIHVNDTMVANSDISSQQNDNVTISAPFTIGAYDTTFSVSYRWWFDGVIDYSFVFNTAIPQNIISEIADNPYALLQPPTFSTYFIPAGTPTIFNLAALHASKPTRIIQ